MGSSARAKRDDVPMAPRPYTNQHLYTALRLTVETYDKATGAAGPRGHATGFVITGLNSPGYLVTNRHVLDPLFRGPRFLRYGLGSVRIESYSARSPDAPPRTIDLSEVDPIYLDNNADIDLAIIDLRTLPREASLPSVFRVIDLVPTVDIRRDVVGAGSEVVIAGYPEVGGEVGARPVLVAGRISSDLRVPATFGSQTFTAHEGLCHAFSRGGMSGAPVLTAVDEGSGPVGTPEGTRVRVVGVNAGHIQLDAGGDSASAISRFVTVPVLLRLFEQVDFDLASVWAMDYD